MKTLAFIIAHHSSIPQNGKPQLDRINNGHKARNFPKSKLNFHVGYHWVIEEDHVVQTREINETGYHALNCGCSIDKSGFRYGLLNYNSVGVCIAGNGEVNGFQRKAFHDIVWGMYTVHGSRFLEHREVKNTACPVSDLHALYEAEHLVWLADDLERKKNALKWATGARRNLLERHIARLIRLLFAF